MKEDNAKRLGTKRHPGHKFKNTDNKKVNITFRWTQIQKKYSGRYKVKVREKNIFYTSMSTLYSLSKMDMAAREPEPMVT